MIDSDPSARYPVCELLSPAGNLDAFMCALAAGADAIYCGLEHFNARRNADNFDMDGFRKACETAHICGAKVYVTVNILVFQDELAAVLDLIRNCSMAGADAFILADWGLIRLVRQLWPDIRIHLSTQANVGDADAVRFAQACGCSRVTVSRELTLEEIKLCAKVGPEVEVFVHGALCASYSGQCLLSSMQKGRSANRGLCRQPCRLPYTLLDERGHNVACVEGSHLLSPKDNCRLYDIAALLDAGCCSLKIEGRMKAPDYVLVSTEAYRRALDECLQGAPFSAGRVADSHDTMQALSRSFNRDFTDSYLYGCSDNTMMSYERGNNRGQLAGEIIEAHGKLATLRIDEPLDSGDLLELRNPDTFEDYVCVVCPQTARTGDLIQVHLNRAMKAGARVRVIRSEAALRKARKCAGMTWPRKQAVDVAVSLRINEPLQIEMNTSQNPDIRVCAQGSSVEAARTKRITSEDIKEHIGRFGDSPFYPKTWDIDLDPDAGISFSELHAARRTAVELLKEALLKQHETDAEKLIEPPRNIASYAGSFSRCTKTQRPLLCALVCSPQAARCARDAGADLIYASALDLARGPFSSTYAEENGREICSDIDWPDSIIACLPAVASKRDHAYADDLIRASSEIVCGNVSWLKRCSEASAQTWLWSSIPLLNEAACAAMIDAHVKGIWLSHELDLLHIQNLTRCPNLEFGICVVGHIQTMYCSHCVLQSMGTCSQNCSRCSRRAQKLKLRDEFGRMSLVTSDILARSSLWQAELLDICQQIPEFLRCGISRFMVDCRLYREADDIERLVRRGRAALDKASAGKTTERALKGSVCGHLFERIG